MSLHCKACRSEIPDSPHGLHLGWPPDQVACPSCGCFRSTTGEYRWLWAYMMIALPGMLPAIALVTLPIMARSGRPVLAIVPGLLAAMVADVIVAMIIACPVTLIGRAISAGRKRARIYRWPAKS